MMTIHEVSKLAGVSVRTLHHYDAIGLLPPTALTEVGYRLYDDSRSALMLIIGFLPEDNVFPKRHIPASMHWRCRSRKATHGSLACFRIFLCR